jgi:hypothetical protein
MEHRLIISLRTVRYSVVLFPRRLRAVVAKIPPEFLLRSLPLCGAVNRRGMAASYTLLAPPRDCACIFTVAPFQRQAAGELSSVGTVRANATWQSSALLRDASHAIVAWYFTALQILSKLLSLARRTPDCSAIH